MVFMLSDIYLLHSASTLRPLSHSAPDRTEFERIGLSGNTGDSAQNLVQPGGSNYDITVIVQNLSRFGLFIFPMSAADVEGSAGQASTQSGGRLADPFARYIVPSGMYSCVGYLLRTPSCGGHWVSLLPPEAHAIDPSIAHMSDADQQARKRPAAWLCDSLYECPLWMCDSDIEAVLIACAMEAGLAGLAGFQAEWGCFLIGLTH